MAAHNKYQSACSPVSLNGHKEISFLAHRRFLWLWLLVACLPFLLTRIYFSNFSEINYTEVQEAPQLSLQKGKEVPNQASITNQSQPYKLDISVGGCNIWKGEWVPSDLEPLYTNASCWFIQEHQNCVKNGRPDKDYLYWRWKPTECDLPRFDARLFLELLKGKSWAFIGDSISRNHFQSFLCSLAQVEIPKNIYVDATDQNVHWFFPSYNFTLAVVWSPFLVQETENELKNFSQGVIKLFLDVTDKNWASSLSKYDYVVFSSGQWYLKTSVYFKDGEVIGCHYCPGMNLTELGFYFAFRNALRTVFDFILSSDYKGIVIFRTFTPDHFENGRWDNGGNCPRTTPNFRNGTLLEGMTAEMYKIQLEEFEEAYQKSPKFRPRLKLADTIHASLLRPDGHPGPYRNFQPFAHDKNAKVQNDCLHWCLPGPIDTWSDMLLEMLKHF